MNKFRMLKPEEAAKRARENVKTWQAEQKRKAAEEKRNPPAQKPPLVEAHASGAAMPIVRIRDWKKTNRLTALFRRAAAEGNTQKMEDLLKAGAQVNWRDSEGNTALDIWGRAPNLDVMAVLVRYGAKTGEKMKAVDAEFVKAAWREDIIAMEPLMDSGADLNARDEDKRTALIAAAMEGNAEIAKLLIDDRANLDAKDVEGCTALIHAAITGHVEISQLLVAGGADINAAEENGWTAIVWAHMKGHKEIFELLRKAGAT